MVPSSSTPRRATGTSALSWQRRRFVSSVYLAGSTNRWPPFPCTQGGEILDKYVALYAAELLKSNAALTALQLFTKYGAHPHPQVRASSSWQHLSLMFLSLQLYVILYVFSLSTQSFNIYRHLCKEVFGAPAEGISAYAMYAQLRDVLLDLVR